MLSVPHLIQHFLKSISLQHRTIISGSMHCNKCNFHEFVCSFKYLSISRYLVYVVISFITKGSFSNSLKMNCVFCSLHFVGYKTQFISIRQLIERLYMFFGCLSWSLNFTIKLSQLIRALRLFHFSYASCSLL